MRACGIVVKGQGGSDGKSDANRSCQGGEIDAGCLPGVHVMRRGSGQGLGRHVQKIGVDLKCLQGLGTESSSSQKTTRDVD